MIVHYIINSAAVAIKLTYSCSQYYIFSNWMVFCSKFVGFPKIALMIGLIMNAFTGFMIPLLYGSFHFSLKRIETIPSEEISSIIYDPLLFHSFIWLCRNEE